MIQNPTIGLIGGTGVMGALFKKFFENEGLKVLIASRKTELKVEECAKISDVVIICVPIDKTIDVIRQLAPHIREESLLMDFTSLKSDPVNAMMQYSKSSVLGCHPMFGPGLATLENQVIVLTPGRGDEWFEWIKCLFIKGRARVKVSTAEKHDKMMAVIQGLMHFTNITISHVLREMDIDIKESLEFSSPIYKLRMDMVGRILNQDPRLYADIEILNPETIKVLETYLSASEKLFSIVKKGNIDEFIDYFNEAGDYMGDFKQEAEEESNLIINSVMIKNRN